MRALLQPIYGEADSLTVGEAPVPSPRKGQVLVQVAAASVNAADVFLMRGVPRSVRPGNGLRRPNRRRLGLDLAGVVADIGPGVTRFKVGDRVFGLGTATFAEFALASQSQLAELPLGVDPAHAATLPTAGTTALRAIEIAKVQPGGRLVVTGIAGGVGQFAAQLAKLRGANVIGVCSGRNVERVRALGIETVIDYETQDPLDTVAPYDAVIDNTGRLRIRDWRRVVVRGGAILPNSGLPGPDGGALMRVFKAQWHGLVAPQRVRIMYTTFSTERLTTLGQLLAAGHIKPLVDTVFDLDRAPKALATVSTHRAQGKVIVTTALSDSL